MFFTNQNAEIVACIFIHSENRATQAESGKYFQIWFFPRFGGKMGRTEHAHASYKLSWTLFSRPGSAEIWGGKKGEFRDWTIVYRKCQSSENLKPVV